MPIDPAPEGGYEPIDPLEADQLSQFILAQSAEGVAVPVLLFGPEATEPVAIDGSDPDEADVAALAGRLGVDLAEVKLYSTEAYLIQCGLGQQRLDTLLAGEA